MGGSIQRSSASSWDPGRTGTCIVARGLSMLQASFFCRRSLSVGRPRFAATVGHCCCHSRGERAPLTHAEAEVMYRLFDVRKFEMVKAALGEQLAAVKNMLLGSGNLNELCPNKITLALSIALLIGWPSKAT